MIKKLLVLMLTCMAFGCGEEEKDWVDIPAIITNIDAGTEAGPDAELDMTFSRCYEERVEISRKADKCTNDLMEFWEYMTYIDEIPCDRIMAGDYLDLC